MAITFEQIPTILGEIYEKLNYLLERMDKMETNNESVNQNEEFLSIKDSAKILQVHPNTIRNWIKEGYLDRLLLGNRVYLSKKRLMSIEFTKNR